MKSIIPYILSTSLVVLGSSVSISTYALPCDLENPLGGNLYECSSGETVPSEWIGCQGLNTNTVYGCKDPIGMSLKYRLLCDMGTWKCLSGRYDSKNKKCIPSDSYFICNKT